MIIIFYSYRYNIYRIFSSFFSRFMSMSMSILFRQPSSKSIRCGFFLNLQLGRVAEYAFFVSACFAYYSLLSKFIRILFGFGESKWIFHCRLWIDWVCFVILFCFSCFLIRLYYMDIASSELKWQKPSTTSKKKCFFFMFFFSSSY